jgi:hypothetical protein
VVTSWGRIGMESKDCRREWMGRGRKSSWEGEQWTIGQEKEER